MIRSPVRTIRKRPVSAALLVAALVAGLVVAGIYAYAGTYGLNVTLRPGGSIWVSVKADDPRLSPSMRPALGKTVPDADLAKK